MARCSMPGLAATRRGTTAMPLNRGSCVPGNSTIRSELQKSDRHITTGVTMRGLVLAQGINKVNRADAPGVFIPGAKYFANLYGLDKPVLLDDVDDRNKVLKAIEKSTMLDVIAYFGHGDRNRI